MAMWASALLSLSLSWSSLSRCGAGGRCAGARLCLEEHERLLRAYDASHRAAAAAQGSEGLGGGLSATEWALAQPRPPLAAAVRALCAAARAREGRVMLGFCASEAAEGVTALKAWVEALGLPKGLLHGMDVDGVPIDMSTFGAVYLKYNSEAGTSGDPPGTAVLSGYTTHTPACRARRACGMG